MEKKEIKEWREKKRGIWYMVGGKKYLNIEGEEYVRTSDVSELEQEAERRGRVKENERCMKLIGEIIQATSWEAPQQFFDGLRCARSSIELKLLEEENGKQNAR